MTDLPTRVSRRRSSRLRGPDPEPRRRRPRWTAPWPQARFRRTADGACTIDRRETSADLTRAEAWALLTEFTKGDSLRKHARAVETSMRAYAERYGEDAEAWGIAGMLHDFDYEMHPRAPHHPMKGAEILLPRGGPDRDVVYAILAHADYSGMPRVSRLDHALYACDELTGFVHACALVRPGKVISRPRAGLGPQEAQGQGVRAHGEPRRRLPRGRGARRRSRRPHRLRCRGLEHRRPRDRASPELTAARCGRQV